MTTEPGARHEFLDHTSEVEVSLAAPSLAGLLAEAGRALAELLAGEVRQADGPVERVRLESADREALLVDWLNALIFLSETRKRVFTEFRFAQVGDQSLEAEVRGFVPEGLRLPVKAATYHRVAVASSDGGLAGRVVLDV
jgi:SHS2 domain-containing protein